MNGERNGFGSARSSMRWLVGTLATGLLLAGCGTDGATDTAGEASAGDERETVQLTTAVGFPDGSLLDVGWWRFVEILEDQAPWVEIDHRGGPEVVDELELVDSIRTGVLDAAPVPNAYYAHELPRIIAMDVADLTPAEERDAGTFEYWHSLHRDELNLEYVGATLGASKFMFYLNSEIDSLDFTGLTLRVNPVYSDLAQQLGADPVSMPFGDVYTAMQRGTVDGFGWLAYGLDDLGVSDVVEYAVEPSFYESRTNLLINAEVWDGLDSETQAAIESSIQQLEQELPDLYGEIMAEAAEQREDEGIRTLTFDDDEVAQFLETAREVKWQQAIGADPQAEELQEWYEH